MCMKIIPGIPGIYCTNMNQKYPLNIREPLENVLEQS